MGQNSELTFPFIKPEKAVGLYLTSKRIQRDPIFKKPLEFDKARDSVSLDLVKSFRELRLNEERLKTAKEKYKHTRQGLNNQWGDLGKKQEELQKSFIDFEPFIRENYEKRVRSQRRISVEEEAMRRNEEGSKYMIEEKGKLMKIKELMEVKIKDYLIYENYLKAVVKADINFKEIGEIMERFEGLMKAKQILSDIHKRRLDDVEKLREDVLNLVSEKTLSITNLNNKLQTAEQRYFKAVRDRLKWEEIIQKVLKNTIDLASEISTVKNAIRDIYNDMCRRKMMKPKFEDLKNQLQFIKMNLRRLDECVNLANLHEKAEQLSA